MRSRSGSPSMRQQPRRPIVRNLVGYDQIQYQWQLPLITPRPCSHHFVEGKYTNNFRFCIVDQTSREVVGDDFFTSHLTYPILCDALAVPLRISNRCWLSACFGAMRLEDAGGDSAQSPFASLRADGSDICPARQKLDSQNHRELHAAS